MVSLFGRMNAVASPNADLETIRQRKQALRTEIARGRRRIDRRVFAARKETSQLTSWKTYVRRYPAGAVVVALGLGVALSRGLPVGQLSRQLGRGLSVWAARTVGSRVWSELLAVWHDSRTDETDC